MVGEISNSEMRGKNVTKGMFDIHYLLEEEEKKKKREKSLVILSVIFCGFVYEFGGVCG